MKKQSTSNGDSTRTTKLPDVCACGKPLHYEPNEDGCKLRAMVSALCRTLGTHVLVSTAKGSWMVPRHFLALHAVINVAHAAELYGFKKIDTSTNGEKAK